MTHKKRLFLLVALFLAGLQYVTAQTIFTVAGNGITSYSGDGGLATAAAINTPGCITFDPSGNMYIAADYRIRRVDANTGIISTFAGIGIAGYSGDGGPATNAKLYVITAMASDAAGNIYLVDNTYNVVRKVDIAGTITTVVGNSIAGYYGDGGPASAAELSAPFGIALDATTGDMYISDRMNSRIRVVNTSHTINTFAGNGIAGLSGNGGPALLAELCGPNGMCIDPSGNLYLGDDGNNTVRKINTSNIISAFAGAGGIGGSGYAGDGGPATNAAFENPVDVKTDGHGNFYISDFFNSVIRKVNSSNIITTYAGNGTSTYSGDGGPATAAGVSTSWGLGVDNCGNLYIADSYNDRIRIVCNSDNTISSASITASSTEICHGVPITFTATSTYAGCPPSYTWYKTGSTTPLGTGPTFVDYFPASGDVIYCVASEGTNAINNVCGIATHVNSNHITLSAPTLQIANVDLNTRCLPGYSSPAVVPQFTTTVTGGVSPYFYSWSDLGPFSIPLGAWGYGLSSNTIPNPTISVYGPAHTFQEWNLTVTDAAGCSTQRQIPVSFITSGYDLVSRDSYFDMYDEPNSQRSYNGGPYNIFQGPDIWNRWTTDGFTNQTHERAEYLYNTSTATQSPNYVYVRVRNVGCIASPDPDIAPFTPVLNAYWTMGGAGGTESWPAYWNGSTPYGSCGGGTAGSPLMSSPQVIPSLNPGTSQIFQFPWLPPNPHCYGTSGDISLCLLDYIDDNHNTSDVPWGLTIDPGTSVTNPSTWCYDNNNMATINTDDLWVTYFHASPPPSPPFGPIDPRVIWVGNIDALPAVTLSVVNNFTLNPSLGTSTLYNYAYFKMFLGPVFNQWVTAGARGDYISMDPREQSVTFDGTHPLVLENIPMPAGAIYQVTIAGYPVPGADLANMQAEQLVVMETDPGTGDPTGGMYNFNIKSMAQTPQGVLAVTEISQGPQAQSEQQGGCEYAEMVVANCGNDMSPYVNVSGWIIDDNDGNFNTGTCSAPNGITEGHYRLAYNSIWQNVPVGSVIVVYNGDNNCYNLPDTFTVDTFRNIFWVPINAVTGTGASYVVERFNGSVNGSDIISYCNDYGPTTVYAPADGWNQTIALAAADAIQVRCPGCTTANPGTPPFYHGIGYAPDATYCFASIPAGASDLGGAVELNPLSNQKYVFMGSTATDFNNPTRWIASSADPAGTPPPSLGNINPDLYAGITSRSLGLPCCGSGKGGNNGQGNRKVNPAPIEKTTDAIKVYPNPASMTLNFEFPANDNTIIRIVDVTGRLIDEQILSNATHTSFNVASYTPGLYLYQVTTNGKTQSGKVVITK